jgi:hypothetical protein
MASKTIVELSDDLDGGKAAETVTFGVDGVTYEIDLSAKNAKSLRDAVQQYIAAGRRIRGGASSRRSGSRRSQDTQAIREWARASGYDVSDRGRLSAEVVAAYNSAPSI